MIVPKKNRAANVRCLFVGTALLLLFVGGAYGDGSYQSTKPGKGLTKSLVWNDDPTPGDVFTWSGERDKEGYATGDGTLTWYTRKQIFKTGANLPFARLIIVGRYSGKMARGKLNGMVVKTDQDGAQFHGKFVDGRKANEWIAGAAPDSSRAAAPGSPPDESARLPERIEIATEKPHSEPPPQAPTVEAPAEGPMAATKTENVPPPTTNLQRPTEQGPSVITNQPADKIAAKPAATAPPSQVGDPASSTQETKTKYDDSLRQLIGPPTKLRARGAADPSSQSSTSSAPASGQPRLTQAEVIALADGEARTRGHDLDLYLRPQAHYNPADDSWSVTYDQKSGAPTAETGLSVSVEDKTKKTSIKN